MYVCMRIRTYVHVGMLCVGYYTVNSAGLSAQFAMRDVNHELIAGWSPIVSALKVVYTIRGLPGQYMS